jgi:hypothetical protein
MSLRGSGLPLARERTRTYGGILTKEVFAMSPWLELLLNVIAFAGFIAIATYHRPEKNGASPH